MYTNDLNDGFILLEKGSGDQLAHVRYAVDVEIILEGYEDAGESVEIQPLTEWGRNRLLAFDIGNVRVREVQA